MNRPFVITISNRKGGTGKSTSVVNLAAEWAARGYRTLVIDLDTQGHAGLGLGIRADRAAPTIHHIFRQADFDLCSAIIPTVYDHLHCIPADPLFDGSDTLSGMNILSTQLQNPAIANGYDVVLLDTPPSLDLLLTNAMAAADGVLIPLLPHALAAEGVKQLSRLFFRIATTANTQLKVLGLLPVMLNARVNHQRDVLAAVSKQFGAERMLRGIRSDIALAEAFAAQQPARIFAPRSRGTMDYYLLAEELPRQWRWPLPNTQQRTSE